MSNPVSHAISTIQDDFSIVFTGKKVNGAKPTDERVNFAALRALATVAGSFIYATSFIAAPVTTLFLTGLVVIAHDMVRLAINASKGQQDEEQLRRGASTLKGALTGVLTGTTGALNSLKKGEFSGALDALDRGVTVGIKKGYADSVTRGTILQPVWSSIYSLTLRV